MRPTAAEKISFLVELEALFEKYGIAIYGGCKGCGPLILWKPENEKGSYKDKSVNGFDGFKWEEE